MNVSVKTRLGIAESHIHFMLGGNIRLFLFGVIVGTARHPPTALRQLLDRQSFRRIERRVAHTKKQNEA